LASERGARPGYAVQFVESYIMSLTFKITCQDTTALQFLDISTVSGRQAIDFDPGAAHQQQFRFKSVGVAGQWLIRNNQTGRAMNCIVRYVGDTKAAAESLYQYDCDKLISQQCKIEAHGITYKGCNVIPESIRRITPMRPIGRTIDGQIYFNVSMTFTQDNPEGL